MVGALLTAAGATANGGEPEKEKEHRIEQQNIWQEPERIIRRLKYRSIFPFGHKGADSDGCGGNGRCGWRQ
jgi:hypothetical protein